MIRDGSGGDRRWIEAGTERDQIVTGAVSESGWRGIGDDDRRVIEGSDCDRRSQRRIGYQLKREANGIREGPERYQRGSGDGSEI